jgi:hypothetical protein
MPSPPPPWNMLSSCSRIRRLAPPFRMPPPWQWAQAHLRTAHLIILTGLSPRLFATTRVPSRTLHHHLSFLVKHRLRLADIFLVLLCRRLLYINAIHVASDSRVMQRKTRQVILPDAHNLFGDMSAPTPVDMICSHNSFLRLLLMCKLWENMQLCIVLLW